MLNDNLMNIKYDFEWNDYKNEILKSERSITFEDVVLAINNWFLLDVVNNQSSNHKWQLCFVVNINNYAYVIPFINEWNKVFLKTIFPDRRYTKIYFDKD